MFLPLQVTIYIISCHSFCAVWPTKWSMHQWSAINPYCPHFSSLLCRRLFDIELQCQLHCLFPIAHLNTWGQSWWKTIDWHKTGKTVFACDCDLESRLWSIIVFQFLTLCLNIAMQITLRAENKRGKKTTEINYEEKLCQLHRWVEATWEGWFLLNYKKVSLGTRDLKWNSQIVLQSEATAHHQPGSS